MERTVVYNYKVSRLEEQEANKFLKGLRSIKLTIQPYQIWCEVSYSREVSDECLAVVAGVLDLIEIRLIEKE